MFFTFKIWGICPKNDKDMDINWLEFDGSHQGLNKVRRFENFRDCLPV